MKLVSGSVASLGHFKDHKSKWRQIEGCWCSSQTPQPTKAPTPHHPSIGCSWLTAAPSSLPMTASQIYPRCQSYSLGPRLRLASLLSFSPSFRPPGPPYMVSPGSLPQSTACSKIHGGSVFEPTKGSLRHFLCYDTVHYTPARQHYCFFQNRNTKPWAEVDHEALVGAQLSVGESWLLGPLLLE
jgi:hypothetical protein